MTGCSDAMCLHRSPEDLARLDDRGSTGKRCDAPTWINCPSQTGNWSPKMHDPEQRSWCRTGAGCTPNRARSSPLSVDTWSSCNVSRPNKMMARNTGTCRRCDCSGLEMECQISTWFGKPTTTALTSSTPSDSVSTRSAGPSRHSKLQSRLNAGRIS